MTNKAPVTNDNTRVNWRDSLTLDDLTQIETAIEYSERWVGTTNNSPLILIAKLAQLLDKKEQS